MWPPGPDFTRRRIIGNYQDRHYSHLEQFVDQTVHAEDIAYVDTTGYLAVRQRARDAYFPEAEGPIIPLMSQQQKDAITVLLHTFVGIRNPQSNGLGGHWHETGEKIAPTGRNIFGNRRMGLVTFRPINLTVYRRR